MKQCPKCYKTYDDWIGVCIEDNADLRDAQAGATNELGSGGGISDKRSLPDLIISLGKSIFAIGAVLFIIGLLLKMLGGV